MYEIIKYATIALDFVVIATLAIGAGYLYARDRKDNGK